MRYLPLVTLLTLLWACSEQSEESSCLPESCTQSASSHVNQKTVKDGSQSTPIAAKADKEEAQMPNVDAIPRGTSSANCVSNPEPVFTYDFLDPSAIQLIEPVGKLVTNVFTKAHSYIVTKVDPDAPRGFQVASVHAPIDASLTSVKSFIFTEGDVSYTEYVITLNVSCEVNITFDHLHDIPENFKVLLDPGLRETSGFLKSPVSLSAGDIVGYTGTIKLDFGVYNTTKAATYIRPERLISIEKDLYGTCPYDYFGDASKDIYYAKLQPMDHTVYFAGEMGCGSPSHDKAGTPLGQWFVGDADKKSDAVDATNMLGIIQDYDGKIYIAAAASDAGPRFLTGFSNQADLQQIAPGASVCLENIGMVIRLTLLEEETLKMEKGNGTCDFFEEVITSIWIR